MNNLNLNGDRILNCNINNHITKHIFDWETSNFVNTLKYGLANGGLQNFFCLKNLHTKFTSEIEMINTKTTYNIKKNVWFEFYRFFFVFFFLIVLYDINMDQKSGLFNFQDKQNKNNIEKKDFFFSFYKNDTIAMGKVITIHNDKIDGIEMYVDLNQNFQEKKETITRPMYLVINVDSDKNKVIPDYKSEEVKINKRIKSINMRILSEEFCQKRFFLF